MKSKISKKLISLALLTAMAISVFSMSALYVSAANNSYFEYKVEASTPGGNARSNDIMLVKIYGTKGYVSQHIALLGAETVGNTFTFNGYRDIGDIQYMTIENQNGIDGWYFNWVKVTSPSDSKTFYGGRWIDDGKVVTFKPDDHVVKLEIQTGSVTYAGTDADVYFRLVDTKGNEFLSEEASSVHPSANAFEKNDLAYMYVYIDSPTFGQIDKVVPELYSNGTLFSDWYLDYIKATHVSGKYIDESTYTLYYRWFEAQ